ncbi:hypothetical protein LS77_001360 [Helicobacter bilis]|uniref:Uncharacterized protein n=2 Tax=Helicobacter bilis TaxID=37372 RepID=A0A6D2CK94_9HELI|nr:hypothetical protein [Helicobacter bilis]EMZ39921.1 hypothetical protein C826_00743 [Helicobacter bilis WiWa]TLE06109.1 hypothetical protein LS77_001360 [Helicobacter bilis]TLE06918.1 hypothetical protein LS76_001100 [Helicobacter bilis]
MLDNYIGADTSLTLGNLPKKQHLDMLLFYCQCIGKIPFYVEGDSKEYTLAIRGSYDSRDYVEADAWNLLIKEQVPRAHHNKYT